MFLDGETSSDLTGYFLFLDGHLGLTHTASPRSTSIGCHSLGFTTAELLTETYKTIAIANATWTYPLH